MSDKSDEMFRSLFVHQQELLAKLKFGEAARGELQQSHGSVRSTGSNNTSGSSGTRKVSKDGFRRKVRTGIKSEIHDRKKRRVGSGYATPMFDGQRQQHDFQTRGNDSIEMEDTELLLNSLPSENMEEDMNPLSISDSLFAAMDKSDMSQASLYAMLSNSTSGIP